MVLLFMKYAYVFYHDDGEFINLIGIFTSIKKAKEYANNYKCSRKEIHKIQLNKVQSGKFKHIEIYYKMPNKVWKCYVSK